MENSLRDQIATARAAVRSAELGLGGIIAAYGESARATKVSAGPELGAALSKLRAARAKLEHLTGGAATADLGAARQKAFEALADLDRALREMQPAPRSEKVWVTSALETALAATRTARERVAELERALTRDR